MDVNKYEKITHITSKQLQNMKNFFGEELIKEIV